MAARVRLKCTAPPSIPRRMELQTALAHAKVDYTRIEPIRDGYIVICVTNEDEAKILTPKRRLTDLDLSPR